MMQRMSKKKNNYKIFTNYDCEYFPCHKGIKDDEFNCLFCYCPLYFIECPGNPEYLDNGLKDCKNCIIPNKGEKAWNIVRKYLDRHWETKKNLL